MEGGGEGVFARVPLPAGATAAVFNGFKVLLEETSSTSSTSPLPPPPPPPLFLFLLLLSSSTSSSQSLLPLQVPLGESNLAELVKEAEEEVYDRLAYTIHMPQEEDFFLDIPPSKVSPSPPSSTCQSQSWLYQSLKSFPRLFLAKPPHTFASLL